MTDAPNPIQEAVAWLRGGFGPDLPIYDPMRAAKLTRWADAIEALAALNGPEIPAPELTELHMDSTGLSFGMRHPIVPMMAEHLAAAFKDAGGVNYVSFEIDTKELGPLLLTMQRRWGETPEKQAQDRLLEIERLRGVVEAVQTWAGDCEGHPGDSSDARLLKALWTYDGDTTEPCPECDGECGEPCAPITVVAAHAALDRFIADWEKRNGVNPGATT